MPAQLTELSPHGRGQRPGVHAAGDRNGAIPACTGPTHSSACARRPCRRYPRVHGADAPGWLMTHTPGEPSPRTRGRPPRIGGVRRDDGAIPACAGPTVTGRGSSGKGWNYPRVRGADMSLRSSPIRTWELSPRAWGRCPRGRRDRQDQGAIPACTGPTRPRKGSTRCRRIYPRVRGADKTCVVSMKTTSELSPRARGRLFLSCLVHGDHVRSHALASSRGVPA